MPKQSTSIVWFLVLTLVPSLSIWLGLYVIKNAVWTFALYHGLCLLPPVVLARRLWLGTCKRPSMRAVLYLVLASGLFSSVAVLVYELMGDMLLSNDRVLALLHEVGYSKELFWPLCIYAILVNPAIEELFWRGVVLNELDRSNVPLRHFGIVWSSLAYAAFHYWIFRLVLFPGWAELGSLLLAIYGGILAWIYRKTGSICTTALAHALLTDLAVVVLLLDLFRRYPGV